MIAGPAPKVRPSQARITARVEEGAGPCACRVRVLASDGTTASPSEAVPKMGTGRAQFYADGSFEIDVPSGPTEVLVERGTEYRPWRRTLQLREGERAHVDVSLERWFDRHELRWLVANPHVHYDVEEQMLERLVLDPRVEDLDIMAVSHVERRGEPYAGNRLPIGVHPASTEEHLIDVGEECRHNQGEWTPGYGHVIVIGITSPILPISRGLLVSDDAPDYPPLLRACEEARSQDGLVMWCHGGGGSEAPVAALHGLIDAVNLLDPWWLEPEFDTWYRMLNCGFRLAASSGSDWYICSSHRVYAAAAKESGYAGWQEAIRGGRTLATAGPILQLSLGGESPSSQLLGAGTDTRELACEVAWRWVEPVDAIEVIADGAIVASLQPEPNQTEGVFATPVPVEGVGWVAARCYSERRTAWDHVTWAHTSPVYLRSTFDRRPEAVAATRQQLEEAIDWVEGAGRFDDDRQRVEMADLYRDAITRLESGELPD